MHASSLNIIAYFITNDNLKKNNNCEKWRICGREKGMSAFKFTNDNKNRSDKYRCTNPLINVKYTII